VSSIESRKHILSLPKVSAESTNPRRTLNYQKTTSNFILNTPTSLPITQINQIQPSISQSAAIELQGEDTKSGRRSELARIKRTGKAIVERDVSEEKCSDRLSIEQSNSSRRMYGSSFTMSTTGALSEMPSYENFSATLSEAPSFSSHYPLPSNYNSLMSPTQLSPVSSPRKAANLRRHKRTKHSEGVERHGCEYPGCTSSFTRSENLRVHQTDKGHEMGHETDSNPHKRSVADSFCPSPLETAPPPVNPMDAQFNAPEYTVPGAYFSPLTSPALHGTEDHPQKLQQQQETTEPVQIRSNCVEKIRGRQKGSGEARQDSAAIGGFHLTSLPAPERQGLNTHPANSFLPLGRWNVDRVNGIGAWSNAGGILYARDSYPLDVDEGLDVNEESTQLWWRAFTELRKEIPETRLHEAWVDEHLKMEARGDIIAHNTINNLIITLEKTKIDLLKGDAPPILVSVQQILNIAKVVQSTLDFKTGGFIWTCLSSVIKVSLPLK
jgi:hypothetical protein